MVRKRASLKDKGEKLLGVKRGGGGQGADILFGTGTEAEPTAAPEEEEGAAPAVAPPEKGADLGGGLDLDKFLSTEAEAAEGEAVLPAVAEPTGEEGMPAGEADLDEELDLDELLSAEAEVAEAEAALPELATTPAAPAPPPPAPAEPPSPPVPAPPAMERPAPAPPQVPDYTPPPVVERPAPAPPPAVERPAPARPPAVERPAPARPPAPAYVPPPPSPVPAVAPPSTVTGAPDLSAPRPPRYIRMVAEDFDLLADEVSPDAVAAAEMGVPGITRLTAEQRDRLLRRPSVQRKWTELERAIEGQYDRILRENVSVSKPITDWCHNMLAEARAIVLNQQVEKLAKAEWNVEQVRARLDRADESRKHARWLAPPIILWGVLWFAVFVYMIFNPILIASLLEVGGSSESFLIPEVFLRTLFFGGVGGVAAVFYHLFKYVRERSFDSQYALSYFGKPVMGMILGSMIYLTLFVLMKALNFLPSGLEQGNIQTVTDVMYAAILFFVSMAAGFKENLAFDLLNRVIKAVLGEDEEAEETPTSSAATSTG
jgi:hypothetical protein